MPTVAMESLMTIVKRIASSARLAALAGVAALAAAAPAIAQDLTVGAFGGVWEKSLRECVITPFEQRTGKKVAVVLGQPVQWMNQIAANPTKPPFDVIYLASDHAFDAINRGIVDKITADKVPEINELEPRFRDIGGGFGVVNNYGAKGLMYNSKVIKNPPKTWKEFVDGTIAGKWKAAIPSINYVGAMSTVMWHFSELYGGNLDNVQPAIDVVKKMLDSKNLVLWSDPNQFLQQLKGGDFDIGAYWDGRAWSFIDPENPDFKFYAPEPGSVAAMTWISKVKGGSDLAWEYMRTALSAEAQGCFGTKIRYGVGNSKAKFDPKVEPQITKFSELRFPPFKDITAERQAKWLEAWNRQIGR